jgi:hypothetical protein
MEEHGAACIVVHTMYMFYVLQSLHCSEGEHHPWVVLQLRALLLTRQLVDSMASNQDCHPCSILKITPMPFRACFSRVL